MTKDNKRKDGIEGSIYFPLTIKLFSILRRIGEYLVRFVESFVSFFGGTISVNGSKAVRITTISISIIGAFLGAIIAFTLDETGNLIILIVSWFVGIVFSTIIIINAKNISNSILYYIFRRRFKNNTEYYLSDEVASSKTISSIYSIGITIIGMAVYALSMYLIKLPINIELLWFGIAIICIILVDSLVMLFRVEKGYYGYNALEAEEIARYIIKKSNKNSGGGGSPTTKHLRDPSTSLKESKTVISGGEIAKFEGTVKWNS
jgi:hypothetical protein